MRRTVTLLLLLLTNIWISAQNRRTYLPDFKKGQTVIYEHLLKKTYQRNSDNTTVDGLELYSPFETPLRGFDFLDILRMVPTGDKISSKFSLKVLEATPYAYIMELKLIDVGLPKELRRSSDAKDFLEIINLAKSLKLRLMMSRKLGEWVVLNTDELYRQILTESRKRKLSILGVEDSAETLEIIDSIFNRWLNLSPLKALGSGEENEGRRSLHALEVRINAQERADFAIRSAVDMLVELTGNLGLATIGNQLYYSGISKLFSQPEFVDYGRIQAVSKLLDNLEPWLHEAKPGEPLNIFIGHENPIGKNSDASLIISKFRSPYSDDSYIGVLGPTRQNYAKIMSLVRHAGRYLENTL